MTNESVSNRTCPGWELHSVNGYDHQSSHNRLNRTLFCEQHTKNAISEECEEISQLLGATGNNVPARVMECRFTLDYSGGIKISFFGESPSDLLAGKEILPIRGQGKKMRSLYSQTSVGNWAFISKKLPRLGGAPVVCN